MSASSSWPWPARALCHVQIGRGSPRAADLTAAVVSRALTPSKSDIDNTGISACFEHFAAMNISWALLPPRSGSSCAPAPQCAP
eukprot:7151297-Prymnesium_polylepis.1